MANYKNIAGHTIGVSLLTGGNVIDLGCRDFTFAKGMRDLGCAPYCLDADPNVKSDEFIVINKAVTTYSGTVRYVALGESGYTSDLKECNGSIEVECVKYSELTDKEYDVLKLDIEGGEYSILSDPNFKPLPKQISVEFHHHVFPEIHDKFYPLILENLGRWYDLVYQREDAPLMDCLFVRR